MQAIILANRHIRVISFQYLMRQTLYLFQEKHYYKTKLAFAVNFQLIQIFIDNQRLV